MPKRELSNVTKAANRASAKKSRQKKQERLNQLDAEHKWLLRIHADVSMEASLVDMKKKEIQTQVTIMEESWEELQTHLNHAKQGVGCEYCDLLATILSWILNFNFLPNKLNLCCENYLRK